MKNGKKRENKTRGTVLSVKTQWWLKVNTKSFRKHAFDGATFPHVVTVKYSVDETEIVRKKWLGAHITPPSINERVTVIYREDKPTRFRLGL
ncbi:MAG: sugar ABC transporter permease [Clostridia bacterium]|nr:sugar ABC transporter permease [Clostridia bacterium]